MRSRKATLRYQNQVRTPDVGGLCRRANGAQIRQLLWLAKAMKTGIKDVKSGRGVRNQACVPTNVPFDNPIQSSSSRIFEGAIEALAEVCVLSEKIPQWGVEASLQDSCAATIGAQSARGEESTTAS
ncbi:hypothetical protein BJY52DRAFT_1221211 [Lactarius psammicola]|nr:hypothetical protein BJY52DRAFT_1221211 [Lactarius psammicola]